MKAVLFVLLTFSVWEPSETLLPSLWLSVRFCRPALSQDPGSSACLSGGLARCFFLRSPTQGEPRAGLSWSSLGSAVILEQMAPLHVRSSVPEARGNMSCPSAFGPRLLRLQQDGLGHQKDFYFYTEKIHGDWEGESEINKANLFWKTTDITCICGQAELVGGDP